MSSIVGIEGKIMSMNPDDVTKYKSLYLQTSWGYLNMLQKNIAFLRINQKNMSAIEASHLAAHSLKSQSYLMGFNQIGKLSGQMEQIFKAAKENTTQIAQDVLVIMTSVLKKIHDSLEKISENQLEIDMSEESKKLSEIFVDKI
jgi:two-component system, chemotaxis family, sensor kinase CheA